MMKKKALAPALSRSSAPKQNRGYGGLVKAIAGLSAGMVDKVAAVANQALVLRNWIVGAWIVEFEQNGKDRAKYGERLLETLAQDLAGKGLKGLELRNLRNCRLLYNVFPQIRQTVSAEFKSLTSAGKLVKGGAAPPVPLKAEEVLRFSWSQLQELIRIEDPWKRAFYENECLRGRWSVRQ